MTKIIKVVHECLKFKKSSIISFDLKITQGEKGGIRLRFQKRQLSFQEVMLVSQVAQPPIQSELSLRSV